MLSCFNDDHSKNMNNSTATIVWAPTSAEVTPKGSLVRESTPKMAGKFRLTGTLLADGQGECRKDARCVAEKFRWRIYDKLPTIIYTLPPNCFFSWLIFKETPLMQTHNSGSAKVNPKLVVRRIRENALKLFFCWQSKYTNFPPTPQKMFFFEIRYEFPGCLQV